MNLLKKHWLGLLGGGGGTSFDPSSTTPDFWLDFEDDTTYASSIDNIGRIIDSYTTKDANAYVTVPESAGSLFKKPSYNGEGCYFNSLSAIRVGTLSSFNKLHNGNAWEMYFSFKYFAQTQATTLQNILSTAGSNANNSGLGLKISNLNSATNPHTLRVSIFNNAGGATGPADITCSNNSLVNNEYNEVRIVMTGTVLTVYIRNSANPTFTQIGTDASIAGLSSSDAEGTMGIGVDPAAGFRGYLKQIIFWYRNLTVDETTSIQSWLATRTADVITPETVSLHLTWGQSNEDPGSGTDNSTLAATYPELAGLQNAYVYRALNSAYTNKQNYWSQLEMSKTTADSAHHNWVLRLGYAMGQAGTTAYFAGAGRGSTGLLDKVASIDWYADGGSVTTGDMFPNWKTLVTDAIEELIHVMRKTPVIYSIGQFQGENDTSDALAVSPAYRLALENWIKSAITFLNGLGYSTTNMHYYLFRTINSGINGPDVRADQLYVMNNFKTDFPAYDIQGLTLISTDGFTYSSNHVTNVGMSQAGQAAADLLIPLLP
jgi:hypothetical protein